MSPSGDRYQEENGGKGSIRIRRGRVDSLLLYEVSEHELDTLARGMPASLFLNFGIALLSIGSSFLTSLLTIQIASDHIFIVFTSICTICFIIGIILMCLWYHNRQSSTTIIKKIKSRIPDEKSEPSEQDEGAE